MYKSRGKPEDPWNQRAAEQEKALAGAIRVNSIQKNGVVKQLNKVPSSIIARQKEMTKKRNNYEEFKQSYNNKLRRNKNRERLSNDLEFSTLKNYKTEPEETKKRFVNSKFNEQGNNADTKEVKTGATLRAPTGPVKTINVAVPARYKERAIFSPPKSGGGEALSFSQRFKQIETLHDNNSKFHSDTKLWQTNLFKELETANAEVDVGNVQLEQISKILKATKNVSSKTNKILAHKDRLYKIEEEKIKKAFKKCNEKESKTKSNKLLLTLNDVDQRIQKMQMKFFNEDRPKYKCLKDPLFGSKSQKQLEILYENKDYLLNSMLPKELPRIEKIEKNLKTVSFTQTTPANTRKQTPTFQEALTRNCEQDTEREINKILEELNSPKRQDETEIFVVKEKRLNDRSFDELSSEEDDEILQFRESIRKSDYLRQDLKLGHQDAILKEGNSLTQRNSTKIKENAPSFTDKILKKLGGRNMRNEYEQSTNKHYSNANFDFAFRDSLFCVEDE